MNRSGWYQEYLQALAGRSMYFTTMELSEPMVKKCVAYLGHVPTFRILDEFLDMETAFDQTPVLIGQQEPKPAVTEVITSVDAVAQQVDHIVPPGSGAVNRKQRRAEIARARRKK
jgi:hypothetical protein